MNPENKVCRGALDGEEIHGWYGDGKLLSGNSSLFESGIYLQPSVIPNVAKLHPFIREFCNPRKRRTLEGGINRKHHLLIDLGILRPKL